MGIPSGALVFLCLTGSGPGLSSWAWLSPSPLLTLCLTCQWAHTREACPASALEPALCSPSNTIALCPQRHILACWRPMGFAYLGKPALSSQVETAMTVTATHRPVTKCPSGGHWLEGGAGLPVLTSLPSASRLCHHGQVALPL